MDSLVVTQTAPVSCVHEVCDAKCTVGLGFNWDILAAWPIMLRVIDCVIHLRIQEPVLQLESVLESENFDEAMKWV